VAAVDLRQRSGYLFVAVILAQVLLISAQVNSRSGVPIFQAVAFGVFAEVQRGVSGSLSSVTHVWTGYTGLRRVQAENDELRRQLAAAQIAEQEQRALADRARGLAQLLDMRDRSDLKLAAADVIAGSATPDFKTLTIDKGTRDGLRTDMAVVSPVGVVGRVIVPSRRAARVQLLIDRNAAAGVLIERSRSQGVTVGNGDGKLRMEYVSEVSDIVVGDLVVTSGIDGIYPKGYAVGKVETVERAGGAFKRIIVRPAVDFSSIEEVLVVLTPAPAHEAAEGGIE
jgi:rod shape-determining protein MreC